MPRTPDPGALQYDLRADHVTRRRQPACRAFMPTLRKRLGHGRSAYAHLAGSTRIHLHQLSPRARSLVPEFGKETVPSGVVDRAGWNAFFAKLWYKAARDRKSTRLNSSH